VITISRDDQFVPHQDYLAQPLGGNTFLLSVSGLAFLEFQGQPGTGWRRDSVEMFVPLTNALGATKRVPKQGYHLEFALQQWTTFVTPNAFSDLNTAVNFGIAVDTFGIDWRSGAPEISVRVTFDVAVRDVDADLHRVAYMLLLIGDVSEAPNVG
jgi:hypothetical protein